MSVPQRAAGSSRWFRHFGLALAHLTVVDQRIRLSSHLPIVATRWQWRWRNCGLSVAPSLRMCKCPPPHVQHYQPAVPLPRLIPDINFNRKTPADRRSW